MSQPSSMFSFAQEFPFRSVTERSPKEPNLEPPKCLEVLFPFPLTVATLALVFAPESADNLELRRGPESENSLPEICIWKDIISKTKFKKNQSTIKRNENQQIQNCVFMTTSRPVQACEYYLT